MPIWRLKAGDTDGEVIDYVVDRYGEYALLEPNKQGANLILWLSGPAVLLLAGGVAFAYIRARRGAPERADAGLSEAEARRLKEILRE
jgi:cytochrome c-type biogenesis protein CcmH